MSDEEPKAAEFDDLKEEGSAEAGQGNADLVMEIPVKLSVIVGNAELSIRKILNLNQGSVVELDRRAGEPLDISVNGTLVAHGEIVVVGENQFGVRLTDVISPAERIKKLK